MGYMLGSRSDVNSLLFGMRYRLIGPYCNKATIDADGTYKLRAVCGIVLYSTMLY